MPSLISLPDGASRTKQDLSKKMLKYARCYCTGQGMIGGRGSNAASQGVDLAGKHKLLQNLTLVQLSLIRLLVCAETI